MFHFFKGFSGDLAFQECSRGVQRHSRGFQGIQEGLSSRFHRKGDFRGMLGMYQRTQGCSRGFQGHCRTSYFDGVLWFSRGFKSALRGFMSVLKGSRRLHELIGTFQGDTELVFVFLWDVSVIFQGVSGGLILHIPKAPDTT